MFIPSLWRVRKFADTVPEVMQLQQEMNRLFSNIGQKSTQGFPALNLWEKDDKIFVTAELPGMDSEKIDVAVSGDVLTIAGNYPEKAPGDKDKYLRQERGTGSFKRDIQLPFQVSSKDVAANYEKGILNITLPRLKEDLPKKIKIN